MSETAIPSEVRRIDLSRNADSRGNLTEIYRREWFSDAPDLLQWNHVQSAGNVLRGVHLHHTHEDYLFMAAGVMHLGLYDARPGSPTEGLGACLRLEAEKPELVRIPTGVAHGFYFPKPAVLFYGVTHYWNPDDELDCRWDDSALGIHWPFTSQPELSPRDQRAGSLADMKSTFLAIQSRSG